MRRRLNSVAGAAALGAVGALAGNVANAPAASSGSPLGYAISAVGFRSYFVLHPAPGAATGGVLRVVNLSAGPRTLLLSAADVSTATAGGLQFGSGAPAQDGRWIVLERRRVQLGAGGAADVPFQVQVPQHVRSGDHFGGIVALDPSVLTRRLARGHIQLRLIPRLAMTVQSRLPGPLERALTVGQPAIDVAPSGAYLGMPISSPANGLIDSAHGNLTIWQGRRRLLTQRIQLGAFVPQTTINYQVPWPGMPVQGSYRVRGILRPAGARAVSFDRTVTFGRGRSANTAASPAAPPSPAEPRWH